MRTWLWTGLLAMTLVASEAVLGSRGTGAELEPVPRTVSPMATDLRITLLGPARGARTEVNLVRIEGRVEGTAPFGARVEFGYMQGGQYIACKTVPVPVGSNFSEVIEIPGEGACTVYAGVVRFISLARVEDVGVRPAEGRDLGTGSRLSATLRLVDDRGRLIDGRVVVYQGETIIGETHTVAGRAQIYDLPVGEYLVRATSSGAFTGSGTFRIVSDGPVFYNVGMRP